MPIEFIRARSHSSKAQKSNALIASQYRKTRRPIAMRKSTNGSTMPLAIKPMNVAAISNTSAAHWA
jgi:hypothetical protein